MLSAAAVITADPELVPIPGDIRVWATVYDQATLNYWIENQITPAFLNEVEVTEIPTLQQAVFDLDIIAPDADNIMYHMKVRIRGSDGAAAVVFMNPTGGIAHFQQEQAIRCNAGPWWHRGEPTHHVCCDTQHVICIVVRQLLGWLGPFVCGDCDACFQQCNNCQGANPCHDCDPCGLSWVLCHWFGHC